MNIDSEHVLSYEVMSQAAFWRSCSKLDGDHIVGIAFNEKGLPTEERVLVIDLDPYFTGTDWITFEGVDYWIDLDVHTVRDVIKDPKLPPKLYPVSLAYYIEHDAYLPTEEHPFVDYYKQNS